MASNKFVDFEEVENVINSIVSVKNETITLKVISDIKSGLIGNIPEKDYYEYISSIMASYICLEPEYSKVATHYTLKRLYMDISKDYKETLTTLKNQNILHDTYISFCEDNIEWINSILDYNKDYDFDYFGIKTVEKIYAIKNKNNEVLELPQHIFFRVASQIHLPNKVKIEETYNYMSNLYFTHASPTIFNSCTKNPQLSSCFLLHLPDDLKGIGNTMQNMMQISKYGGGLGVNISDIRSRNSIIKSNCGKSDGIIPLIKFIESLTRYVNQSGKRAGSIAIYIEAWHADIFEFLDLKKNVGDINLRARDIFQGLWICDLFMQQVEKNADWYLMNPDECKNLTSTIGTEFEQLYWQYVEKGKYIKKVNAQDLYKKILEMQIETGMPYMLFKDACNTKSNQQNLGVIKNANLCSEIVQYSDENEIAVCNLASICLPKFVKDNEFDFKELAKVTQIITENLNNIIDRNFYPTIEAKSSNMKHRPIGIGVQGLANVFLELNYNFDSDEACLLNKNIFECIYYNALKKSCDLAKETGYYKSFVGSPFSFGKLQFDLWNIPHTSDDWLELKKDIVKYGVKNSLLTTVMPTASTSQLMNNNESIEPFTTNLYVRNTNAGYFIVVNKYLVKDLQNIGLWNHDLYQELLYDNGSVQNLDIPLSIKNKYKTAFELKQSCIIKQSIDRAIYIDQSQSLNLFMAKPDFKLLHNCHMYSWKNGLKTGMYYLRSRPAIDPIKFGIDPEFANKMKIKRNNNSICKLNRNVDGEVCITCSA